MFFLWCMLLYFLSLSLRNKPFYAAASFISSLCCTHMEFIHTFFIIAQQRKFHQHNFMKEIIFLSSPKSTKEDFFHIRMNQMLSILLRYLHIIGKCDDGKLLRSNIFHLNAQFSIKLNNYIVLEISTHTKNKEWLFESCRAWNFSLTFLCEIQNFSLFN
jgi:hypothetical protein